MAGLSVEYLANGMWTVNIPGLAELTAKYSVPTSQRVYTRYTWFTHEGRLSTKSQIHFPPAMIEKAAQMGLPSPPASDTREFVSTYQLKGDTLITTDSNKTNSYYLKKK